MYLVGVVVSKLSNERSVCVLCKSVGEAECKTIKHY